MEENKQEEILKVILDRLNQEEVWFTSKEDDVYGSAKNLFKLDEYGDLNDKSRERLINEVEDLLGDGATYLIEAVDQWIQDNLIQGTISYTDNLHMNYTPKEISEEITAYQEKGVEDLELGTLDEKGKEKKLESKKIVESTAKLYQIESNERNHGKAFARYNEIDSIDLNDYKEVANIDIKDNMSDDDALEYVFTLGNTNQDLRDANPEMRSVSVSDIVELNGKYYYCDAFGWKEASEKLVESKKVTESDNEDTLEVRTYFGIQILGSNFDGEDYLDNGEASEMLDRYPEIEPDELFDKANKKVKDEDLVKYLPDNLKDIIHSIKLHFESTELVAVIKADKSFYGNDKLKEELAEYLEGQYSDGWGEGFEQQSLLELKGIEDDQGKSVEADVFIQPMLRYDSVQISLTEKKTLKNSKEIGRKKVVEVITDLELGNNGLPKLPDPYEMQYRFQDDLYQIINKGPEGIEGYCYAISDEDSYTGTWSIYGKSDEGIIDYEDNIEDYNECVKLLSKFDDVALQESKKLKSTLYESSNTSKRKRLNEENQKSADLISKALSSKDFDMESPTGQIISRTSELFNVLSSKQYDVQVTFDNGESQSAILLGNQGGKVVITITNGNEPLKAFASGNFELTEENFEVLKDIKEQISVL